MLLAISILLLWFCYAVLMPETRKVLAHLPTLPTILPVIGSDGSVGIVLASTSYASADPLAQHWGLRRVANCGEGG